MILLAVIVSIWIFPSGALSNFTNARVHNSNSLKMKCDSLPYRTTYTGNRCYFAVMRQVSFSESHAQCSSIFPGAKVASNVTREIFKTMMLDFHESSNSKEAKYTICVYDSGYACETDHQSTVIPGKCIARADKKMNYVQATQYCASLGMELPSIGNDLDNQAVAMSVAKDPVWIQYFDQKEGKRFVWKNAMNFIRFSTCDNTKLIPSQYAGHQSKLQHVCEGPIASVISKTGYWWFVGQHHQMDVVCVKDAENKFTGGTGICVALHEFDPSTRKCKWIGQEDACAQLIDHRNKTWFMPIEKFPVEVVNEVNLYTTGNPMNDIAVKVVVRQGCMFTGYNHGQHLTGQTVLDRTLLNNAIYGEHTIPSLVNGMFTYSPDGLTRPHCKCDPGEATLNGHVPTPPADRKCVEHHVFNETTEACEWILDRKYCGELITHDGRRMMLEIPNWPTNRKYDVDHRRKGNENFHETVTNMIIRKHCFGTILSEMGNTSPRALPASAYGNRQVISFYNGLTKQKGYGAWRVVCECIR